MNYQLVRAYEFFKANAGYCVGHSSEGALSLARAEQVARDAGATFEWDYDCDADDSFVDTWDDNGKARKQWDAQEHECEYCLLRDAEGNVLASLSSIWDASADYRRVVQAELASEAIDTMTNTGAGI